MIEDKYISIAEFAEKARITKQAVYKQLSNEKSQLTPYVLREGRKTLINVSALTDLYGVEVAETTFTTSYQPNTTPKAENQPAKVEIQPVGATQNNPDFQPVSPDSTPDFNPISTDYIEFLKAQITELKAEKATMETRLNATIEEKDSIIKEQSAELAKLAQQIAQIADKALITTSQQQYLTAKATVEKADNAPVDDTPIVEQAQEQEPEKPQKKGFWERLFGR